MVYNIITEKGSKTRQTRKGYIMEKIIIHDMTGENTNKTKTVIWIKGKRTGRKCMDLQGFL